jgi:hypothetical protein
MEEVKQLFRAMPALAGLGAGLAGVLRSRAGQAVAASLSWTGYSGRKYPAREFSPA